MPSVPALTVIESLSIDESDTVPVPLLLSAMPVTGAFTVKICDAATFQSWSLTRLTGELIVAERFAEIPWPNVALMLIELPESV